MFTGIIEARGDVVRAQRGGAGARLVVETHLDLADTKPGDSIAVDGVCLTVVALEGSAASFDVGPESLAVTTLGGLQAGARVHVERAVRLSDRLGGHLVQGHVDGTGRIASRRQQQDALHLRVAVPKAVTRLCIHKGSIGIQGVSLTINALDDDGLEVCLIPHTLERTNLGDLAVGAPVNLENDLVGKYVERLLGKREGVTWALLQKSGFVDG